MERLTAVLAFFLAFSNTSETFFKKPWSMWIFLLRETLIPEMWKPVFRNTETVLIGLMDIYRVQLICQAQIRFAVRSRLYDWVETDKLVLLQSHIFLGFLMPDSRDMVAGIFNLFTSAFCKNSFWLHLKYNTLFIFFLPCIITLFLYRVSVLQA